MFNELIPETIKKAKRPLSIAEICERSGLSKAEVSEGTTECIREGVLVAAKGGRYADPRVLHLTLCRAKILNNAPAFASPMDGTDDFYMDMPEEIAMDGDLVFVRETAGGERRRGTLVYVVKRKHSVITGTLHLIEVQEPRRHKKHKNGRPHFVCTDEYVALVADRTLPERISVTGDVQGAKPGDLCVFEVAGYPEKHRPMFVRVKQVLGSDDDLGVHLSAICAENGIEQEFPPEALQQAEALPEDPCEKDFIGREDLRAMLTCTIDGADAKDFDDAVSLQETENGYLLGVHIADVSHYVTEGSPLNAAARARGTSVYLPGRTIPMLPEKLCNCLCSLMPGRERLTMSALMEVARDGSIRGCRIVPSVIKSRARLTYDEVNRLFAGEENGISEALRPMLLSMNALSKTMYSRRVADGALELDIPEPDFRLDDSGYPVGMGVRGRGDAHRLIEEFMLAANRCVARHADSTNLPFAYRVHEKPDCDKLAAMETVLEALGRPVRIGSSPNQHKLQEILSAFRGKPQQGLVSSLLLRAMSKAHYSEKNLGHFGLAFNDYCHFTSPIRRYPDLLTHRMLKLQAARSLSEEEKESLTAKMHLLTEEASEAEEHAAACEREGDALMFTAYMTKHKDQILRASVTHFIKKGAFAALDNGCEGLIPFHEMDDSYSLDDERVFMLGRRTHRIVRLGDRVQVRCVNADVAMREVEFELLPEQKTKKPKMNGKKA